MSRVRNWVFTSFEQPISKDQVQGHWPVEPCTYLIIGEETCPRTNRRHLQGYAEFSSAIRLPSVKTCLAALGLGAGCHCEPRRGTQDQAITYCKKDGEWREYGRRKEQGKSKEVNDAADAIRDGARFTEVASALSGHAWCQYGRGLRDLAAFTAAQGWEPGPKRVVVRWGASGTGKSRWAFEHGFHPVEFSGGTFINGYEGQRKVLFDDFEPGLIPRNVFLRLLDRYAYTVNVKGGSSQWTVDEVCITSNFDPRTWYSVDGEGDPAVMRRLSEVTHLG